MSMKLGLSVLIVALIAGSGYAGDEVRQRERARERQRPERTEQRRQRAQERRAFQESLKDMSEEQREAAVKARTETQYQENLKRLEAGYQAQMADFMERVAANPNISNEQKQEKLGLIQEKYRNDLTRARERYERRMAFHEASPEQREEMRKQMQEQRRQRRTQQTQEEGRERRRQQ